MSKSNEADLQRKEAIEKLKGERIELLEEIKFVLEMKQKACKKFELEIDGLHEKISIIDDQIHTIDPSQV